MNILYVCPYTPTSIRTRPYNLIHTLARRGHAVTLATLWENADELKTLRDWEENGVKVISAPLTKRQVGVNAAMAFASGVPLQSMYCWQPELVRKIETHIASGAPIDLIHVEHLRGARYGLHLKEKVAKRIQIVWDSVDCISYLFEQAAQASQDWFGRWVTRFELGRTRQHESWLVRQFNQTLVTAEQDKQAFAELERTLQHRNSFESERVTVLRNGVALSYFSPSDAPRDSKTIIFTGKMSYHANVTAAWCLLNDIMPRVWESIPDARAQIVGYKPPRKLLDAQNKNPDRVAITGSVPDIRPYLAKATVAVAPILYGTGIQNKVLEAMAMQTPVVAMPKATSALSARVNEDFLLGNDPDQVACQIIQLLSHPALATRVGQAGRRYVETQHDWTRITEQLESIYTKTITNDSVRP